MMLALVAALALQVPLMGQAADEGPFLVLKAAAIHAGDGQVYRPGYLAIRDGKLAAVGQFESDAALRLRFASLEIVDLGEREISPGLVDGVGYAGLLGGIGQNEEASEITPLACVSEVVFADHPSFAQHLQTGVTSMVVQPGTRNVIGGLACHVKTFGATKEAILARDRIALRITMGTDPVVGNRAGRGGQPSMWTRRPTSRMSVIFMLRREFERARSYDARRVRDASEPRDPELDVLLAAMRGEIEVHWHARQASELEAAMRLAEEFKIPKNVLLEAHEIDAVAPIIRRLNDQGLSVKALMGPLYHPQYRGGSRGRFGMPYAVTDGTLWPIVDPTAAEARFLVHLSEHAGNGACVTCVFGQPCALECSSCSLLFPGNNCAPCIAGAPCATHPFGKGQSALGLATMSLANDGFAVEAFAGQGRFGIEAGPDYDPDLEAMNSCVACCGIAFSPIMPDEQGWARFAIREVLDAGVDGAFARGASEEGDTLLDFARFAVRVGVSPAKALAMVTSDPARILGIEDRVGRLQPGMDADLLIFSQDPLAPTSAIQGILVGGRVALDDTGLFGNERE